MTGRWTAALMMMVMSVPVLGQSLTQGRFALTPRQVARALSAKGTPIEERDVTLLANVVASEPDPVLDILKNETSAGRKNGGQPEGVSIVKLACHQLAVCLPFYAIVSRAGTTEGDVSGVSGSAHAVKSSDFKQDSVITMRAGTHATLVMDDNRSHIQVAVISLENGAIGHRIHVSSPDHKQFYVAEVVSATLLKRSF